MERDFLAELAASQQAPKTRKRGGLAGIWDRNKNVLRPVVSGALGLVNPALGAAAGAAMRGLDRPGKGGIGLDVGQAVRGGLEGYGAGAAASALKGGAQAAMGAEGMGRLSAFGRGAKAGAEEYMRQPLLGRGTADVVDPAAAAMERARTGTATTRLAGGRELVPNAASMMQTAGTAGQTAGRMSMAEKLSSVAPRQRGLSRVLQFIEQNPQAAGLSLQALSGIMGSQSERRIRERQEAEERRRAQNLAMLALPLYDPMMGRR